jgi:DNA-binding response OmpR family regulator
MPILIVSDDTAPARFIRKGLETEHYSVDASTDGEQGRSMALDSAVFVGIVGRRHRGTAASGSFCRSLAN